MGGRRQLSLSLSLPNAALSSPSLNLVMDLCRRCRERSVVLDPASGIRVCSSCGVEQSSGVFQSQAFTSDGRATGAIVRSIGGSVTLDRRIFLAEREIGEITSRIGLSAARSAEVLSLVWQVIDGEFGSGDWFTVLVAACACIIMRKNRFPLSIAEAAASISRDAREVGRMMIRVCNFLDLPQLPEFDVFQHLERILKNCPSFAAIKEEKLEEMIKQGIFLLQCAVKWSLSTGRHPLPLVAAVVSFVAELNDFAANLKEIADYSNANPNTCETRKKELLETLIQVAKEILPWGEDVTIKNILHYAPFLLKLMERRSNNGDLDLAKFVPDFHPIKEDDSKYYSAIVDPQPIENVEELKISGECLLESYKKAVMVFKSVDPSSESAKSLARKKNSEITPYLCSSRYHDDDDGLSARKNLSYDEILERDVGYDPPPPSFIAGLEARQMRKEKIASAKQRISKIKRQKSSDDSRTDEHVLPIYRKKGRKRQKQGFGGIDVEDCVIELLLLHQVSEDEIEHGHYNRLLDLYVFTPMDF